MEIRYDRVSSLTAEVYVDILLRSGLAERRPVADLARINRMLENSNLILVAYEGEKIVGISRAISDFAWSCYLSDLAVDKDYQGRGIGTRLIEETRRYAGAESMCLLIAAPAAVEFYKRIGMPALENGFLYSREQ